MFQYKAPSAEVERDWWDRKAYARVDKAIHRGLQTIKVEQRLSLRQLQKKIQKEWARTEHERDNARTCPGSSLDVHAHKDGSLWIVQDGQKLMKVGGYSVLEIPIAHYWDVMLNEEAWGQFSRFDARAVWNVLLRQRRQMGLGAETRCLTHNRGGEA